MFRDDRPYKVAFTDIDGTLLIKDAQGKTILNPAVVAQLKKYDEVALFTQRGKLVVYNKFQGLFGERCNEDDLRKSQIDFVLSELKKQLPGKQVLVSTTFDEFSNNPKPGAYYSRVVKPYEDEIVRFALSSGAADVQSIDEGRKALLESAHAELSMVLSHPAMLEKCYAQLLMKLSPHKYGAMPAKGQGRVQSLMFEIDVFLKTHGNIKKAKEYEDANLRSRVYGQLASLDEVTKKALLHHLIASNLFIDPLQDKVGQFQFAVDCIAKEHPNAEFTIFEDSALNLAEIESKFWGRHQPIGVLVVDSDGLDTARDNVRHLNERELDQKINQQMKLSILDRMDNAKALIDKSTVSRPITSSTAAMTHALGGSAATLRLQTPAPASSQLKSLEPQGESTLSLFGVFAALSSVLLNQGHLEIISKPKSRFTIKRGEEVCVDGKDYRLSSAVAKIVALLAEYNNTKLTDPDDMKELLKKINNISKNWLGTKASKRIGKEHNLRGDAAAIAKQMLTIENLKPEHRLHAALYQALSPLFENVNDKTNNVDAVPASRLDALNRLFDQPAAQASSLKRQKR